MAPKYNGMVDYLSICLLIAAPSVMHFSARSASFNYEVAATYLGLSLLTDYELGAFRFIPFQIHGAIEFSASIALLVIAFVTKAYDDLPAYHFYLWLSLLLGVVSIVSNYSLVPEEGKKKQ